MVGVRYKGFSSSSVNYKKNPFNIKVDYIINGQKMWITNGTIAQIAVVWAKVNTGRLGPTIAVGDLSHVHVRLSLIHAAKGDVNIQFEYVRRPQWLNQGDLHSYTDAFGAERKGRSRGSDLPCPRPW